MRIRAWLRALEAVLLVGGSGRVAAHGAVASVSIRERNPLGRICRGSGTPLIGVLVAAAVVLQSVVGHADRRSGLGGASRCCQWGIHRENYPGALDELDTSARTTHEDSVLPDRPPSPGV